jgi:AraC-type transcriptional regulator N-terminus
MLKMMNATSERQARRMQADREELAERIAKALPHDGTVEPQPGLHFRRHSKPAKRVYGFYPAAFCVITQGSKDILLGDHTFRYDPAHYLISTMELPLIGEVVEAPREQPYLSFRLVLDPS